MKLSQELFLYGTHKKFFLICTHLPLSIVHTMKAISSELSLFLMVVVFSCMESTVCSKRVRNKKKKKKRESMCIWVFIISPPSFFFLARNIYNYFHSIMNDIHTIIIIRWKLLEMVTFLNFVTIKVYNTTSWLPRYFDHYYLLYSYIRLLNYPHPEVVCMHVYMHVRVAYSLQQAWQPS